MIPEAPDLMAMLLKVGEFVRDIGPFILLGAAAAAAQRMLLGPHRSVWHGERLIAPVATIPLGLPAVLAAIARSWLLSATAPPPDERVQESKSGAVSRTFGFLDGLILPFLLSALIGSAIVVLTPTEPLWSLLSPPEPWRLIVAPLLVGLIKPRGGTELPLVFALITKGLDPAGMIAGIAGAGYLHARSLPLGLAHLVFGSGLGALFWLLPL